MGNTFLSPSGVSLCPFSVQWLDAAPSHYQQKKAIVISLSTTSWTLPWIFKLNPDHIHTLGSKDGGKGSPVITTARPFESAKSSPSLT